MALSSKKDMLKFIDIGANLVDSVYTGIYNGHKKHETDISNVLDRSWKAGLSKIIITGTSLSESQKAVEFCGMDERLFCSVGCHPTNCSEISTSEKPQLYIESLKNLIESNSSKVKAVGEFGLDYDRLHFCQKDIQIKYFQEQLVAFSPLKLPLFLHCRNAFDDLLQLLKGHRESWGSGVVHSFDGTVAQAEAFIDLGLHIGINGCSLKTEENLKVVKAIPKERLLLETDSPWCEVRPTHAGFQYIKTQLPAVKKEKWQPDKLVKGRNEPANIRQVLEIVAAVRGEDIHELGELVLQNTNLLFFNNL